MAELLKIYLAGPEVFLPDALAMGAKKKALCRNYGFEGLFPLDSEILPGGGARLDRQIYAANIAMIRAADAAILNLTPYQSPSADVGTIFELGFLTALGKPAFAYTNESESLLTRMQNARLAQYDEKNAVWRDGEGNEIEDFGNADNLMIDASLDGVGHGFVRRQVKAEERWRDLGGFEECLRQVREYFRTRARKKG
jgi:nucleoside 2-deoxyribosyltransferase